MPFAILPRFARCAALALLFATAACDGATEPELETGNVTASIGAQVEQTDTGVVVNGEWRVRFPPNHTALWLDRFVHYDFGGFPELGYEQSARRSEAWVLMLTHEKARVERNDSLIFSFFDHGDLAVEDSTMMKRTELPGFSPGAPIRFENFVRYLTHSYLHVDWAGGGETTFHHTPYHDALAAGDPISVTSTGSEDAAAVTATFQASPTARMVGLTNGDVVGLDGEAPPVLSVQHALAISFDRPLDPDHAFLLFHPMPQQVAGAQRAFVQPVASTDRVVIPASVLDQLLPAAAAEAVAYRLLVLEVRSTDDVWRGTLEGAGTFSLPFAQASSTSVNFYLER